MAELVTLPVFEMLTEDGKMRATTARENTSRPLAVEQLFGFPKAHCQPYSYQKYMSVSASQLGFDKVGGAFFCKNGYLHKTSLTLSMDIDALLAGKILPENFKYRGLFISDSAYVDALADIEASEKSPHYPLARLKNGDLGKSGVDAVSPEEFEALLKRNRKNIVTAGQQILAGHFPLSPVEGGLTYSPYLDIMRFDRALGDRYREQTTGDKNRILELLKDEVLIERIIQKILAGTSVDNFLIVTFTNAAAHEMRQRLEIAIEKRLQTATGKQKRFLQEQLLLLPAANISTIDAYALRLIEMYYHVIGLDPQFRLLSDTAERELMRQDVLIEVFAEFYAEENDNHQDFLALVNNFGNPNHDDALQNIVLKLADFAEARADGTQWLENLRNPYRVSGEPLVKTDLFTKHIKPFLKADIADLTEKVQQIQLGVDGVDELQKTQDAFDEIATYLSSVAQQIETGSWDALQSAILAVPAAKMNTQTKAIKEDPDLSALVAAARQVRAQVIGSKSQLKPWLEDYFILNESAWLRVQGLAFQLIDTLVTVTQSFRKSFEQAKRDAKLLDFPDLGTLALQILSDDVTKQTIQRPIPRNFS
ncbi:hypothetical protein Pfo_031615 [Paulownia fortunei]|nr:hypothetical protein Pfo_031615 [Paulownia fortunei]